MRLIASLLLVLPPQEAAPAKPVPPPAGSGVHVTSKLESSLSVRFTADGKELRKFDRKVEEQTDVTIEVVSSLAAGLTEEEAGGLEKPSAPPPFVRLRFGECPVKIVGPEGSENLDSRFALESKRAFFIERGTEKPVVHALYAGSVGIEKAEVVQMHARALADADGLVTGPRFAPLVLDRKLEAGTTIDVEPAVVAPLAAQVVADGTVTKAQLTFKGPAKDTGPAKDKATELLSFGITMVVEWKGGEELPTTATFELSGELKLVKATAQPFALELSGPVRYGGTGDENGAKLEIAGTGSLSFTYRAEPTKSQ